MIKMMRGLGFWLLLLALLALACQGLQRAPVAERDGGAASQGDGQARNRIAYVGGDQNIYIVDPDSGEQTAITTDGQVAEEGAASRQFYRYPTWSPDGRFLAYVSLTQTTREFTSRLLVVDGDGRQRRELYSSRQNSPFYLYWSPDSQNVTFLSSAGRGPLLDLQIVPLSDGEAAVLDTGQPYYWHWSPDGQRIFSHVGGANGRLSFLLPGADDSRTELDLTPLAFQAPAWSPDGTRLLLAATTGDGQDALLLTDPEGNLARTLVPVSNPIAFGWSPDGQQIAYIDGLTPQQSTLGTLNLLDLAGQALPQPVDDDVVFAFFWSPDGSRLAYFVLSEFPFGFERQASRRPVSQPAAQESQLYLELRILNVATGEVHSRLSFDPTDEFLNVLPFFDQYQHSARLWSPDSRHLVIAAAHGGDAGLWIVPADPALMPRRLADGLVGFWSWQ